MQRATFLAFAMVQHIMTELSGAVTDKEKATVITKTVFTLLKNNANNIQEQDTQQKTQQERTQRPNSNTSALKNLHVY
jgi:hypothetical protein